MDKINHKYSAEHIYNEGVFLNAKGKEVHWAWYKPTDKQIMEEVSEVINGD